MASTSPARATPFTLTAMRIGWIDEIVNHTYGDDPAAFEDAKVDAKSSGVLIEPPKAFPQWAGRWGYKSSAEGAPFDMEARDAPLGIPSRFQKDKNNGDVIIRTMPKDLHNQAVRTGDPDGLAIP